LNSRFVKKSSVLFLAALLFLFAMARNIQADEILLANGDRVSGEILYIDANEIQIETPYAGTICVLFSQVSDLSTDTLGRLLFKDGRGLEATIESLSNETIVLKSDSLGLVTVPVDSLARFEGAGYYTMETSPSSASEAPVVLQAEADIKAKEEKLPKIWTGSFTLGTQLQQGNSDNLDVHFEAAAVRKAARTELGLKLYANYGETEGETDENSVFGEAKLKYFPNTRWYLFALTTMEYDQLEDLDLRAQVFGGPGYYFIDKENVSLLGEIGLGLTAEFYDVDGQENTLEPSLRLNAEWKQKLAERIEFSQCVSLYPSLSNFGDYLMRSTTSLSTSMANHWWIKLSAIDEYDSDPEAEDVERNDLRIFSSIEYKF
jgi:putative salt-induced outer membrane protein YdiY